MSSLGFPEEEYRLKVFKDLGFVRKFSEKEKEYYWIREDFAGEFGESPAVKYSFIDNPIGKRVSSLEEVRNAFLNFFSEKGHKIIEPYPVVARWRNDLYLTDASIVDFQPYVTDGIIPPPANPLVISQPCIRLVDLDNVGLTFGRHMSIFEMGGHHAFNYENQEVYWKDETVRYAYEFMTKVMKIPGEMILFKESYWSGGGNAGPSFEVIVGGLEVATLVFMRFKVLPDGKLVELPIRTVDTGYGMERFLWLTTGAPSSMFVVHPKALNYIIEEGKITYDEDTIKKYVIELSGLSNKGSVKEIREEIAKRIGVSTEYLEKQVLSLEKAFKIVDHSKSLVFILSEGVIPSNEGVGYLARLLFRRIARNLRSLGILDRLIPLLEIQIDYWSKWFKHLKVQKDEIIKVASVEFQKYEKNYQRASSIVLKELETSKEISLNLDRLIELYDSHGFTPEEINDILQTKRGITIEIPNDFYKNVALRHTRKLTIPQQEMQNIPEAIQELKETKKKYYEDMNLMEHTATVIGVFEPNILVLDETIFYPEGGGQPCDQGIIERENGEVLKVLNVVNFKNRIVHFVEGTLPEVRERVKLKVNEERRWALRRAHTATHIVNWATRTVLGNHVWQHGAQKDVLRSRLDVTHYEALSEDEVRKIEELANKLVLKDVPVKIEYLTRTEAESKYGFRIYQGGVVPSKEIRIVKVGDYEIEACGGLHVDRTGQVGLIKILKTEKIQDGVVRLIFSAGIGSLLAFQESESIIRDLEKELKVDRKKLPDQIKTLMQTVENLRKELEEYKKKEKVEIANRLVKESIIKTEDFKLLFYVTDKYDLDDIIEISNYATQIDSSIICFIISTKSTPSNFIVKYGKNSKVPSKIEAGQLAKTIGKKYGGGGGGKENFGKGGIIISTESLEKLKNEVLLLLTSNSAMR